MLPVQEASKFYLISFVSDINMISCLYGINHGNQNITNDFTLGFAIIFGDHVDLIFQMDLMNSMEKTFLKDFYWFVKLLGMGLINAVDVAAVEINWVSPSSRTYS